MTALRKVSLVKRPQTRKFFFETNTRTSIMTATASDTTVIDTGTEELLCEIRERVAVITLNRPQARNSLSDNLTPALRRMIRHCGEDPTVGALLMTGAGDAFCAGGDVKGMAGKPGSSNAPELTFDQKVAVAGAPARSPAHYHVRKPTIAALPGPAGAGLSLARLVTCALRRSRLSPQPM